MFENASTDLKTPYEVKLEWETLPSFLPPSFLLPFLPLSFLFLNNYKLTETFQVEKKDSSFPEPFETELLT